MENVQQKETKVIAPAKLFLDQITVKSTWMIPVPTIQLTNLGYNCSQQIQPCEIFEVILNSAFAK